MQCAQKRFRTERPLLLQRHDGEERIRIDVQVPHLYHLNRQLPEKFLPGCKLLRPIVETGEIQEIQRNINTTFQRIADRGFDILKVIAGTIIRVIAFSARADNGNAQAVEARIDNLADACVYPALEFMLICPRLVFSRMRRIPAAMFAAARLGSPSQPCPKLTIPSGATER